MSQAQKGSDQMCVLEQFGAGMDWVRLAKVPDARGVSMSTLCLLPEFSGQTPATAASC